MRLISVLTRESSTVGRSAAPVAAGAVCLRRAGEAVREGVRPGQHDGAGRTGRELVLGHRERGRDPVRAVQPHERLDRPEDDRNAALSFHVFASTPGPLTWTALPVGPPVTVESATRYSFWSALAKYRALFATNISPTPV